MKHHSLSIFAFLCIFSLTLAACSEPGQSPSSATTHTQTARSSSTAPIKIEQPQSTNSSIQAVPIQSSLSSVIVSFYQELEAKNYNHAYTYVDSSATLSGHTVTEAAFTQTALAADSTSGPINDFTFIANSADQTQIIMTITRTTGSHYHAHLQLQQEKGGWKIGQIDII